MDKYQALTNLENDKKQFEAGDDLTLKDFPKEVLEHWVDKGLVKRSSPASKPKTKKKEA